MFGVDLGTIKSKLYFFEENMKAKLDQQILREASSNSISWLPS